MISLYFSLIETDEQRETFRSLYENYYGLMYHTALSVTHDRQLAEDAVHETCLRIIELIDTIRTEDKKQLAAYLRLLTRSRTIDYLRSRGGREDACPAEEIEAIADPRQEDVFLTGQLLEQALGQLAAMPEEYRIPLTLQVKGYTIREIAQTLGLTEGAAKTRIHRARQMLRRSFEG